MNSSFLGKQANFYNSSSTTTRPPHNHLAWRQPRSQLPRPQSQQHPPLFRPEKHRPRLNSLANFNQFRPNWPQQQQQQYPSSHSPTTPPPVTRSAFQPAWSSSSTFRNPMLPGTHLPNRKPRANHPLKTRPQQSMLKADQIPYSPPPINSAKRSREESENCFSNEEISRASASQSFPFKYIRIDKSAELERNDYQSDYAFDSGSDSALASPSSNVPHQFVETPEVADEMPEYDPCNSHKLLSDSPPLAAQSKIDFPPTEDTNISGSLATQQTSPHEASVHGHTTESIKSLLDLINSKSKNSGALPETTTKANDDISVSQKPILSDNDTFLDNTQAKASRDKLSKLKELIEMSKDKSVQASDRSETDGQTEHGMGRIGAGDDVDDDGGKGEIIFEGNTEPSSLQDDDTAGIVGLVKGNDPQKPESTTIVHRSNSDQGVQDPHIFETNSSPTPTTAPPRPSSTSASASAIDKRNDLRNQLIQQKLARIRTTENPSKINLYDDPMYISNSSLQSLAYHYDELVKRKQMIEETIEKLEGELLGLRIGVQLLDIESLNAAKSTIISDNIEIYKQWLVVVKTDLLACEVARKAVDTRRRFVPQISHKRVITRLNLEGLNSIIRKKLNNRLAGVSDNLTFFPISSPMNNHSYILPPPTHSPYHSTTSSTSSSPKPHDSIADVIAPLPNGMAPVESIQKVEESADIPATTIINRPVPDTPLPPEGSQITRSIAEPEPSTKPPAPADAQTPTNNMDIEEELPSYSTPSPVPSIATLPELRDSGLDAETPLPQSAYTSTIPIGRLVEFANKLQKCFKLFETKFRGSGGLRDAFNAQLHTTFFRPMRQIDDVCIPDIKNFILAPSVVARKLKAKIEPLAKVQQSQRTRSALGLASDYSSAPVQILGHYISQNDFVAECQNDSHGKNVGKGCVDEYCMLSRILASHTNHYLFVTEVLSYGPDKSEKDVPLYYNALTAVLEKLQNDVPKPNKATFNEVWEVIRAFWVKQQNGHDCFVPLCYYPARFTSTCPPAYHDHVWRSVERIPILSQQVMKLVSSWSAPNSISDTEQLEPGEISPSYGGPQNVDCGIVDFAAKFNSNHESINGTLAELDASIRNSSDNKSLWNAYLDLYIRIPNPDSAVCEKLMEAIKKVPMSTKLQWRFVLWISAKLNTAALKGTSTTSSHNSRSSSSGSNNNSSNSEDPIVTLSLLGSIVKSAIMVTVNRCGGPNKQLSSPSASKTIVDMALFTLYQQWRHCSNSAASKQALILRFLDVLLDPKYGKAISKLASTSSSNSTERAPESAQGLTPHKFINCALTKLDKTLNAIAGSTFFRILLPHHTLFLWQVAICAVITQELPPAILVFNPDPYYFISRANQVHVIDWNRYFVVRSNVGYSNGNMIDSLLNIQKIFVGKVYDTFYKRFDPQKLNTIDDFTGAGARTDLANNDPHSDSRLIRTIVGPFRTSITMTWASASLPVVVNGIKNKLMPAKISTKRTKVEAAPKVSTENAQLSASPFIALVMASRPVKATAVDGPTIYFKRRFLSNLTIGSAATMASYIATVSWDRISGQLYDYADGWISENVIGRPPEPLIPDTDSCYQRYGGVCDMVRCAYRLHLQALGISIYGVDLEEQCRPFKPCKSKSNKGVAKICHVPPLQHPNELILQPISEYRPSAIEPTFPLGPHVVSKARSNGILWMNLVTLNLLNTKYSCPDNKKNTDIPPLNQPLQILEWALECVPKGRVDHRALLWSEYLIFKYLVGANNNDLSIKEMLVPMVNEFNRSAATSGTGSGRLREILLCYQ